MSINSHIQIPNTILKHFRDESDSEKQVWYLDIISKKIERKTARRLGTEKGYYSREGEKYWSDIIETPIGKLNHQVMEFCDGKITNMIFSQEDMGVVKRYMESAIVRSESSFEAMRRAIQPLEGYTEQQLHDSLSIIGMSVVGEITDDNTFVRAL